MVRCLFPHAQQAQRLTHADTDVPAHERLGEEDVGAFEKVGIDVGSVDHGRHRQDRDVQQGRGRETVLWGV